MLSENEQRSDVMHFQDFLRKNLKILILYACIGGITAFVLTFFIPKEYKSYGIVFPPSSTSIDNSIDFPNFGYDVEADRLIQIFGSAEIRDSVVKKFKLIQYYKIDTSNLDWQDNLSKKYQKNIKFERTPAMSVLLSVRSKSPVLSAAIVNYIIQLAEAFREKIYKRNIVLAYENAKQDYDAQKQLVDSLETSLSEKLKANKLSSLLFLMSDAQISFDMDKLSSVNAVNDPTIGGDVIAFKGMYELLKEYRNRLTKVKKTYSNPIPGLYIINYGEPNYHKISPSFTINIMVGALFSLLAAAAVLFIRQNSRRA